jgi:hypothetical protein
MFDTAAPLPAQPMLETLVITLPEIDNPWQALGYRGLRYLLHEFSNGFAAAKHIMPFPRDQFKVETDFQEGDVFQRALILDTLLDFDIELLNQLHDIIISEAEYLFGTRRKTGIGGWAYFPGLSELPPDADDLAQVMQALLRAGYPKRAALFFELPLNVLLNDQANTDNGWESWIIPEQDLTEEQQLQKIWINKAWGTGSDIEVVANLIYALTLFDKERFAAAIERGINFLLKSHQNTYSWASTWYYGEYYGTYVSIRAICAANGPKDVIKNAIIALEERRQANGGWAMEDQPTSALQTALALLTLSTAKQYLGYTFDSQWLDKSLHYLQQTINPDNSWDSSPFIRMPMGRPHGYVHTILTYESAPITTNFVAKACTHIHQNHLTKKTLS